MTSPSPSPTPPACRAYDTVTEWWGPSRATAGAAERDATRHNAGCAQQGGYGSALVAREDLACRGRAVDAATGATLWPPHGRSCGAVRWPR